MYCHNCGTELTGAVDYCPNCGARTESYYAGAPVRKSGANLALLSMIFGILSLFTAWIPLAPGWALGIAGLVLGTISLSKKQPGKGMAIAGIVCGSLALLLSIALLGLVITAAKLISEEIFEEFGSMSYGATAFLNGLGLL